MEIEEPELPMPPFKSTSSAMDEQVRPHKDASEFGIDTYQLLVPDFSVGWKSEKRVAPLGKDSRNKLPFRL
jgi:hypothetical protein